MGQVFSYLPLKEICFLLPIIFFFIYAIKIWRRRKKQPLVLQEQLDVVQEGLLYTLLSLVTFVFFHYMFLVSGGV